MIMSERAFASRQGKRHLRAVLDLGFGKTGTLSDAKADIGIRQASTEFDSFETSSVVHGDLQHSDSRICARVERYGQIERPTWLGLSQYPDTYRWARWKEAAQD